MSWLTNIKLIVKGESPKTVSMTADIENFADGISRYEIQQKLVDALVRLMVQEIKEKYGNYPLTTSKR